MSGPAVDRAEIGRFVNALFKHADEDGYVSLRVFEEDKKAPKPVAIEAVQLNGQGLDNIVASGGRSCVASGGGVRFPTMSAGHSELKSAIYGRAHRPASVRRPRERLRLEIVKRPRDADGFHLLPRRWVIERTLDWLGRRRRSADR